ncbi:MAG: hypothetical protein QOD87_417 [Pseudonocardiales bacterium]|nr:hypothetical protein [Pseudonocardiales bacterium]
MGHSVISAASPRSRQVDGETLTDTYRCSGNSAAAVSAVWTASNSVWVPSPTDAASANHASGVAPGSATKRVSASTPTTSPVFRSISITPTGQDTVRWVYEQFDTAMHSAK